MLETYLIAVFITLLTGYGFRTRKAALESFLSGWRREGTLFRLLLWAAVFGVWAIRAPEQWERPLVVAVVGLASGEVVVALIRRGVRGAIQDNVPLSRPQTHLLPFAWAAVPALIVAFFRLRAAVPPGISLGVLPRFVLEVATGLVALFCWSTTVTVSIIGLVRAEQFSDAIEPHLGSGEVIGVLERLFTFVLVLSGGLAAVGFAVAAKAAARYPQFKNPAFAEYFLIGTLSSVGLATAIGLLVRLGLPAS